MVFSFNIKLGFEVGLGLVDNEYRSNLIGEVEGEVLCVSFSFLGVWDGRKI